MSARTGKQAAVSCGGSGGFLCARGRRAAVCLYFPPRHPPAERPRLFLGPAPQPCTPSFSPVLFAEKRGFFVSGIVAASLALSPGIFVRRNKRGPLRHSATARPRRVPRKRGGGRRRKKPGKTLAAPVPRRVLRGPGHGERGKAHAGRFCRRAERLRVPPAVRRGGRGAARFSVSRPRGAGLLPAAAHRPVHSI